MEQSECDMIFNLAGRPGWGGAETSGLILLKPFHGVERSKGRLSERSEFRPSAEWNVRGCQNR